MTGEIENSFISEYDAAVHQAYQRQGSMLRGSCRTKPMVVGNKLIWQKTGKGTASSKGRHALVPTMNVSHDPVEVTLTDHYAADWVDRFDLLKTNIDEMQVQANAGAWALGRKTDDLVIAAATKASADIAHDSTGMTLAKSLQVVQHFMDNDVPFDGQIYAILPPRGWTDLMQLKEFASADYIEKKPFTDGPAYRWKDWNGINWMFHTGVVQTDSTWACLAWHQTAIGHAIGEDVQTVVSYENTRASWFVNSHMSQDAKRIDDTGVCHFEIQ
ncbi:MAG: hypothetical protein FJX11_23965 [Alphaproteobacteria bacterium]|nr:hypothetical protein [Alphaproteobacteria bacterium]